MTESRSGRGCRPPARREPEPTRRPEPLSETLARRLLAQRVLVLFTVPSTTSPVTRVSAELMTLDAEGDESVTLRVDCGEAALAPALTLMDVIELMGVPVRALCLGQVGAGAIGVVAVCAHRSAMPSTRFSLCEPTTQHEGHVRNVAQWAELQAAERRRFCERVRGRRRAATRRRREGHGARTFPQRGGGGRVRHPRRSVPAGRRRAQPARIGVTTHGVPAAPLTAGRRGHVRRRHARRRRARRRRVGRPGADRGPTMRRCQRPVPAFRPSRPANGTSG